MEGLNALYGDHILTKLSVQQIVDCSSAFGNQGCNGGFTNYAFQYIIKYGIEKESDYPYVARSSKCKVQGGPYKANKLVAVKQNDCEAVLSALNIEPLAVAVDASTWSYYSGGVLSNCGKTLNHAALLVGYVSNAWKLKNTWGVSWGEKGYIRIQDGNTCGICSQASYLTY